MNLSILLFAISFLCYLIAYLYYDAKRNELRLTIFEGESEKYTARITIWLIAGSLVLICSFITPW